MVQNYTISDLSKEFDLTTRAIRFYEDMGLLQPQRSGSGGRNRIYSARDRARLRLTLRAKRLGLEKAAVDLASATSVRDILTTIEQTRYDVVVIDSIQTMYLDTLESAPGTVAQVRASAQELIRAAKKRGTTR